MTALPQEVSASTLGAHRRPVTIPRPRRVTRSARQPLTVPVVDTRPAPVRLMARLSTRGFVLLVALLFTLTLGGVLALNTLLTQGSFTRYELVTTNSDLVITEQGLAAELAQLQSPQNLAAAAYGLGMVPNTSPVFIDATTGAIRGTPVPAVEPSTSPLAAALSPAADAPVVDNTVVPGNAGETPLGLRPVEGAR